MFTDNEDEFVPYDREAELVKQRRAAIKGRDREEIKEIGSELVNLYVRHGEYFKMSDQPDPRAAIDSFKKALKLQPNHPLAHYRLGHLLYRNGEYDRSGRKIGNAEDTRNYPEIAYHFGKALEGSVDQEGLDETQEMLANMMLVNCGKFIARDSLLEIEFYEKNANVEFDKSRIDTYREKLLDDAETIFTEIDYWKITSDKKELMSEKRVDELRNKIIDDLVLLMSTDAGYHLYYDGDQIKLSLTAFTILYFFLQAEAPIAVQEMNQKIYIGDQINSALFRKTISDLKEKIIFWDEIIESTTGENGRAERKLVDGLDFCIIVKTSAILPDEKG